MMVDKSNIGMGKRSWRYAAVINNGVVEQVFEEPGMVDNCETDPYIASTPSAVLLWLKSSSWIIITLYKYSWSYFLEPWY